MKVTFVTSVYRYAHGKEPRGAGWWGFDAGEFTCWFQGTYTQAKKLCKERIASAMPDRGSVIVTVLP